MKTAPLVTSRSARSLHLFAAALVACTLRQGIADAEVINIPTHADSIVAEVAVSGPSTSNANYSTFGGTVPSGSILQDILAPDATGTFSIKHSAANGGGTIAEGTTGQSWLLRVNPGQTGATNTYNTTSWLQFDLSQFSPADTINAASLNLTSVRLASGNPAPPSTPGQNISTKRLNVFGLRQSQMLIGGQPWTEANLNYNSAPSMFQDAQAPNTEKSQFVYDYLDLVPDGNTDATNMIATQVVGTATTGYLLPGLDAEQILTLTTAEIASFVQSAINAGDDYVTFIFARRESSTSDQFFMSREGATAANNELFFPRLTLDVTLGPTGDFDGDGDVDGADFIVWQTNHPTLANANDNNGDADNDNDVDGADFAAWQLGFPTAPAGGASTVPEPTALVLIIAAGIGTAKLAWPRRRQGR